MTISACTEPAYAAGAAAVTSDTTAEEPSGIVAEGNEEEHSARRMDAQRMEKQPSAFAKLLAGLLQKTKEDSEALNNPGKISKSEDDESGLPGEDILFGMPQITDAPDIEFLEAEFPQTDMLNAVSQEQMNFLHGVEHQLNFPDEMADPETEFDGVSFNELSVKDTDDSDAGFLGAREDASALKTSGQDDARLNAQNAAKNAVDPGDGVKQSTAGSQVIAQTDSKKDRPAKSANAETKDIRAEEQAALKKTPEKESRGRLDVIRNRSRRDRVAFDIQDFRTPSADKNAHVRVNAGLDTRVQGESTREITLELRLPSQGQSSQAVTQANTSWESKAGTALENMLARELHQNFNGDIVRHASMALRNGGEGTIRLALKPESLGNVKIHLEMAENKITGHIVVESEEAMNAFKKEIASLEQAFRDSGYENAELDLSLTADGRNAQSDNASQDAPFVPESAASRYDAGSASSAQQDMFLVDVFFRQSPASVNLLA